MTDICYRKCNTPLTWEMGTTARYTTLFFCVPENFHNKILGEKPVFSIKKLTHQEPPGP